MIVAAKGCIDCSLGGLHAAGCAAGCGFELLDRGRERYGTFPAATYYGVEFRSKDLDI